MTKILLIGGAIVGAVYVYREHGATISNGLSHTLGPIWDNTVRPVIDRVRGR